jgi:hypothetical protein
MISGVVGDEKRFAKEILTVSPTEGFEEVGIRFRDEGFEKLKIFADGRDGGVPGVRGGWFGRFRPVFFGPLERMITAGGRRRKMEDVPLCNAQMLEELPGGVWQI